MHTIRAFVYAACALSLASCASQTSQEAPNVSGEPAVDMLPKKIEASWSSTSGRYPGAGGDFELDNFRQRVRFGNSSCPGYHPFAVNQTSGNKVVLVGKFGNPCGDVRIELMKNQNGKWAGTYEADLPDEGKITQE